MSSSQSWLSNTLLLLRRFHQLLITVLASNWFFYGTVLLFVIGAGWIAVSAVYPLIFDEDYHLGIIDIYAQQLSPFIANQPDEAKFYGDITTLTSYLYHYLMSFPYRFIGLFTDSLEVKIIFLRFINVLLVAASLLVWRKVLFETGISRPISHVAIFFFTMLPIATYLAAHINYDNLTLLLIPTLVLLALRATREAHFVPWVMLAAGLGGFMLVVKFTMLPVVAVIAGYIALVLVYNNWAQLTREIRRQWSVLSRPFLILSALFMLAGLGLSAERYLGNIISYGSYSPGCEEVQPESVCENYSVWVRNTEARERAQTIDRSQLWNPIEYSYARWVPHIFNDMFVVGAFPSPPVELHRYIPSGLIAHGGNSLFRFASWVLFVIGLVAIAINYPAVMRNRAVLLLLVMLIVYAGSLWIKNYNGYQAVGQAFATQGRYLVPFVIPLIAIAVWSLARMLKRLPLIKTGLFSLLLIIILTGAGGAATFVLYSDPNWKWDIGNVRQVNESAQNVLQTFTTRL